MKKLFFALLVGAFLGLVSPYVLADSALVGSSWDLLSFNGTGATGTLEVTDTVLHSKFCNNVSQGYVLSGETIVASGVGMSTLMYCEGLPMSLETTFTFEKPATFLLSGTTLKITTDAKDVFVFEKAAPMICTLEYMPVCGIDGITYGNACGAAAAKVSVVSTGVCVTDETCISQFDGCNTCTRAVGGEWACTKMFCATPTQAYCTATSDDVPEVGGDEDAHGCKGSAGYSRSQSQLACVRVWENTGATALQTAYDFAFNNGMTTMENMTTFRTDDMITRQEAAKMLVSFGEQGYDKAYASFPEACNTPYTDESLFDSTLKSFIYSACAHGMMKGAKGAFFPNDTLTKGQALAVLMRIADGRQEEPDTATWWMPYVTRASELNYITFDQVETFNDSISRGDLITLAHTIFLASVNK